MSKSIEAVGTGALLSPNSYAVQVGTNLIGFGHTQFNCPPCRENTAAFNYGLAVNLLGPWITQSKNFAGSTASVGYLPADRLTISVVNTYRHGVSVDGQRHHPGFGAGISGVLRHLLPCYPILTKKDESCH